MSDIAKLKYSLLAEAEEDHVGLWEVIGNAKRVSPNANSTEIQRITLDLVNELLNSGLIEAGFPASDGRSFIPWSGGSVEMVNRIKSEWNGLGREPNLGDVVWFNITDKGIKELNLLRKRLDP